MCKQPRFSPDTFQDILERELHIHTFLVLSRTGRYLQIWCRACHTRFSRNTGWVHKPVCKSCTAKRNQLFHIPPSPPYKLQLGLSMHLPRLSAPPVPHPRPVAARKPRKIPFAGYDPHENNAAAMAKFKPRENVALT